ncbi:MAG TPA: hypothetical protein VE667_05310 [Xanthobacteraceae bacterium]|nr:hypothetical protein [Xanthobacteraceae bacterium]
MLVGFPLLIIPFAFFNMAVFLLNMSFTETVFSIPLPPDREMPVDLGDLIVAIGILLLWIELVKAVRPGGKSMIEHVISFLLFAGMAAELVFVPEAESPTLLLLAVLGFVDFMAGISARLAQPKMIYQRPIPVQPAQQASPRS